MTKIEIAIKSFNKILDFICAALFAIIFVIVVYQVTTRYFFNAPAIWTEEVSRILLVWMIFLGSIITMRDSGHIEIGVLENYVPGKVKKYLNIVSSLFSTLFLALVIFYGIKLVLLNTNQVSTVLGVVIGYVYLCIPIGAIGMIIYVINSLRRA